jgi:hypothetical protein
MSDEHRAGAPFSFTLCPPQWACPVHGATEAVVTFVYPHGERTLCLHCCLDLLDRLGVRALDRVD